MKDLQVWSLVLAGALGTTMAATADAREPDATIVLWPDGAPLAKGTKPEDRPEMLVFLPKADKADGAAVVVCPGGGYQILAMGHEGYEIAEWLNSLGVTAVVLKYRMAGTGYQHPAPLWDAQRAIRIVRQRAGDWKVDAQRVGILGFSAGGHLASTAATHFDKGDSAAKDPIDRQSCRPDFAVLCYPVITLLPPHAHRGSGKNLLGENPDEKLVEKLSTHTQVSAETPPTFLWHTAEDKGVVPDNSILFYQALLKAKVPAEVHIYEKGSHGLGLARGVVGAGAWPNQCADWLRGRGMLKR
jgi:acetyl esterase/lipase